MYGGIGLEVTRFTAANLNSYPAYGHYGSAAADSAPVQNDRQSQLIVCVTARSRVHCRQAYTKVTTRQPARMLGR